MGKKIDRRALLGLFAAGAPIALMGASCDLREAASTTGTLATVGAQLVADVQGLSGGLKAQFPSLAGALMSPQVAQVQGYLNTLGTLASSLNASLTQSAAQPIVSQVVGVVQQIGSVAGPLLPPPWGLAMSAALALLPVLARGVGLADAALQAPQAGGMSPEQARAVLGIRTVS